MLRNALTPRCQDGLRNRRATKETSSSLAYEIEVVVHVEVYVPVLWWTHYSENELLNNKMLEDNLDMIDERRDQAMIRIQNYQQATTHFYNSKFRPQRFNVGELINIFEKNKELNADKLGTN